MYVIGILDDLYIKNTCSAIIQGGADMYVV